MTIIITIIGCLLFLLGMFGVLYYFFRNKTPKKKTITKTQPEQGTTTSSATSNTTTSNNKWGFWSYLWAGVAIVVIIFLIIILWNAGTTFVHWCKTPSVQNSCPQQTQRQSLVLMFDKYTPCNPSIDYQFELDTQGDPIYLKFPGVSEKIYYSGKGTIKVPPRKSGPVEITSANPNNQARVRIWEVIYR